MDVLEPNGLLSPSGAQTTPASPTTTSDTRAVTADHAHAPAHADLLSSLDASGSLSGAHGLSTLSQLVPSQQPESFSTFNAVDGFESNGLLLPSDARELPAPSATTSATAASPVVVDPCAASLNGQTSSSLDESDLPTLSQLLPPPLPPRTAATTIGTAYASSSSSTSFATGRQGGSLAGVIPRYIPAGTATAVTFNGEVLSFGKRRRTKGYKAPNATFDDDPGSSFNLIGRSVYRLLDEIESLQAHESVSEKEKGKAPAKSRSVIRQAMWVDQYRPKKFTDLLGDERIHREVLSWLKEWDQCVFKRKTKRKTQDGDAPYEDAWGRPREKVLLISGPPGLGKTTLAHVVATQAGYSVVEINASDDRSGKAIDEKVRHALESQALNSDKPTLAVIDEIDGATGSGDQSFIRNLLKLLEESPKRKKGKGRGKQQQRMPLLRPIICICNDLYAPTLRPLRPLARIVRFHKPSSTVLVKRLRDICDRERLRADLRSLTLLVEITSGDIRSCLNTLQFIKSKSEEVLEAELRSAAVGLKDSGPSIQKVWEKLFRTMNPKRKRAALSYDEAGFLDRLLRDIMTCDYGKLAQGCFEHYPNLRPSDDGWHRYDKIHEWLFFAERLNEQVHSNQQYELLGFMPYTFLPWHLLFATVNNPLPDYPKADYESFVRQTSFNEVVACLAQALPPSLKNLFNQTSVITELGPLVMRIISPDIRPVNSQVIQVEERAALQKLVNIMLGFNVRFIQDKSEDGQLFYRLDPPIDVFVQYDGKRSKDVGASRYAVRQLIAREMEAEAIKRQTAARGGGEAKGIPSQASLTKRISDEEVEKPAVDFFGRPIVVKLDTVDNAEEMTGPPPKKFRVAYKYHEGFSNAVRKPVKISSLL